MNAAIELWRSLSEYIEIYMDVPDFEGEAINDGEEFTARFRVRNIAPSPRKTVPKIHFKNPKLVIKRAAYAYPMVNGKKATQVTVALSDTLLKPGERSFVSQTMKADGAFYDDDIKLGEPVAKAAVWAQLDIETFFVIQKHQTKRAVIDI